MAEIVWKGNSPHTASISISVDEVGVAEVTEVLICKDAGMASRALNFKDTDCPVSFPRPFVKGSSADRIEGGMFQVTRNFSAVVDEDTIGEYKIYKASAQANQEPIQAHPEFRELAGTVKKPVNGAVFDAEGNFTRFTPYIKNKTTGAMTKNRKCGITNYMMPILKFNEEMLVLDSELGDKIKKLGRIDSPPSHPLRPTYKGRNYLLSKADPEWVADGVYRLKREWSLSGPKGWDQDVYPLG